MPAKPYLQNLPFEVRLMVYDELLRGAEVPRDLRVLQTCKEVNTEVTELIKHRRSTMIFVVPDAHWRMLTVLRRDQFLNKKISLQERKDIRTIKFIGDDSNVGFWVPDLALGMLAHHGIEPRTVILHYSYTPTANATEIAVLVDITSRIVDSALRVMIIKITNVPKQLVIYTACQLLNARYAPNVDMQKMSDDLVADFTNGNKHVEVAMMAPIVKVGGGQRVVVHITTLER